MSSAERYARLWQGQWVSGSGDALSRDNILAAVNLEGPITGAVQGFVFVAGLDIGLVKDASDLVRSKPTASDASDRATRKGSAGPA
jgi:hypothetical protein